MDNYSWSQRLELHGESFYDSQTRISDVIWKSKRNLKFSRLLGARKCY